MNLTGVAGRLVRYERPSKRSARGRTHQWRCVASSERAFLGNFFRTIDVEEGGFPGGTVFEHIRTGKRIIQPYE